MSLPENLKQRINLTSKAKIYRGLRRSIINGHCKPGERLDIDQIASEYTTSVTPVRDALQMLSQDGLVTIEPRSGYFVTQITFKELRDLMEFRKLLELAAVELAAIRISKEQIEQLRTVHAGYTGDDDESYDRYTDENRSFHYLIGVASGNLELARMIGHLHDRLARFMVLRRAGETQEKTHANIISALQARDIVAARQALLEDIGTSREAILDGLFEEVAIPWNINSTLLGPHEN